MEKNKSVESEIIYVLKLLKRKWYVVLLTTMIGIAFLFYLINQKAKVVYQTSTTLIIGNTNIAEMDLNQRYINTYCAMVKTSLIMEKTSEKLKYSIPASSIQNAVTAAQQLNTQFMDIKIIWSDPEEAVEILNALSDVFIQEAKNYYSDCNIVVMEKVKSPQMITKSKKILGIIGPVAGLVIGILIIFLLDLLDNTIRTEEDVRDYLDLLVIGEIPKDRDIIKYLDLEDVRYSHSILLESFRTLRTNVEFITSCNNSKALVITSGRPGEGKTSAASILASVIAQTGKRTVLIDCDLRNPSVHKLFYLTNYVGLSNCLAGKVALKEIMRKSGNENLIVITSGVKPPNPAELLSSENMREVLKELKEEFDFIIIDTPPSGLVTDAQILSRLADGCILVVSSGNSVKADTLKAKTLIQNVGGKIIGVTLNKVKDSSIHKNYYYYYGSKGFKNRRHKNYEKSQ